MPKTIYFWREMSPSPEEHWYLSQWYVAPFEHDGTRYQTAEMWMMVQKAVLFGDEVSQSVNPPVSQSFRHGHSL